METIENYISILPKQKKDTKDIKAHLNDYIATHRKLLTRVLFGMTTVLIGKRMLGPKKHTQPSFISASSEGVSCASISTQHIRMFNKDKSNADCFQVSLHGGALVGASDSKWTVCKTQFPRSYRYLQKSVKI